MINMKDLIKKQTNLIRKESGMNIKEADKSEFHNLEGWQKKLPGFKEKDYEVIMKVIMMSHNGITGVLKDYRNNKADWTKWIKKMTAKGMWK